MATAKKAAKKVPTRSRTVTLTTGRNAKATSLINDIRKALGKLGCLECRSGIDRFVYKDKVLPGR